MHSEGGSGGAKRGRGRGREGVEVEGQQVAVICPGSLVSGGAAQEFCLEVVQTLLQQQGTRLLG